MTRPLIYLAHPLADDWEGNIASSRRYAERLARVGFAPVAPYLTLYGLLHEPADRAIGLEIDEASIRRCDALLVCGGRTSHGMQADIDVAQSWGIPIFFATQPDRIDERLLSTVKQTQQTRRP